jgi:hypothetical protein
LKIKVIQVYANVSLTINGIFKRYCIKIFFLLEVKKFTFYSIK